MSDFKLDAISQGNLEMVARLAAKHGVTPDAMLNFVVELGTAAIGDMDGIAHGLSWFREHPEKKPLGFVPGDWENAKAMVAAGEPPFHIRHPLKSRA